MYCSNILAALLISSLPVRREAAEAEAAMDEKATVFMVVCLCFVVLRMQD